jgi:REP element-mobilizing transposase RayT
MARKLRIEFPGAIYHVLNRGNYRRDLFLTAGEAGAFVATLREAVQRYGWRLHAYVLMRNHYHLALETPEPNLKDGMHWLQSTFCTRFNRFRKERGHLFQGRYQSLLVENEASLARLVNYIHLNPVRAKIVSSEQLPSFRWSSLGHFVRSDTFPGMDARAWLNAMQLHPDSEGWSIYLDRLRQLALDPSEQERLGFGAMSRGWAIGTKAWRSAVAKDHAHLVINPGLAAAEAREVREARWTDQLNQLLIIEKRTLNEALGSAKSAEWKIALALKLRQETGASVTWLANALYLGKASSARNYFSKVSRRITPQI